MLAEARAVGRAVLVLSDGKPVAIKVGDGGDLGRHYLM